MCLMYVFVFTIVFDVCVCVYDRSTTIGMPITLKPVTYIIIIIIKYNEFIIDSLRFA